jgi:D-alanyl-D-alanine carboxypeptidase (penicillin-binding protein 5/6)
MTMDNHNKLLGKVGGVDGLKTGYTAGAGYCLSATAERDGRRVISVIMGSFGPGGQVDKGKTRDLKAIEHLERGFAALPPGGPKFSTAKPATDSPVSIAPPPPREKLTAPAPAPSADGTPPPIKLNIPGAKK